jgi:hypothetical protein
MRRRARALPSDGVAGPASPARPRRRCCRARLLAEQLAVGAAVPVALHALVQLHVAARVGRHDVLALGFRGGAHLLEVGIALGPEALRIGADVGALEVREELGLVAAALRARGAGAGGGQQVGIGCLEGRLLQPQRVVPLDVLGGLAVDIGSSEISSSVISLQRLVLQLHHGDARQEERARGVELARRRRPRPASLSAVSLSRPYT